MGDEVLVGAGGGVEGDGAGGGREGEEGCTLLRCQWWLMVRARLPTSPVRTSVIFFSPASDALLIHN